jgi:hypothetical protein
MIGGPVPLPIFFTSRADVGRQRPNHVRIAVIERPELQVAR